MNFKGKYFYDVVVLAFLLLFVSNAAALKNADFELYEPNELFGLGIPIEWDREFYTAVTDNFIPFPDSGHARDWLIDTVAGINSISGDTFVVLSTGNMSRVMGENPGYATVWQEVLFYPGDRLSGFYFFGTCDYTPYNDFGKIYLEPVSNPQQEEIEIVYKDVTDVGDHSSMLNWERFDYVFDVNTAGIYNLRMLVDDEGDAVYESYLLVDGLRICHDAPENGDINLDCTVNFEDFAMLAVDWLCDCNDRGIYVDYSHNCIRGSELTDDGMVDINDLNVLSQNWLDGMDQVPDCNYRPEFGDFNYDCRVNLEDFAMFAYDWLCDCSQPEVYLDYYSNCRYQTDMTEDRLVDVSDLVILVENWLLGSK